jgi:uncharacterized ion transporter superfamily protein YfcC
MGRSNTFIWQLIAVSFALLIVGILVEVDVARVPGIVIVCIAAAIGIAARILNGK